ncbi:hypothetical protein ACJ73_03546 [Blastomyces percursus]|uniref:Uncharacterized protein n=1 Tax=Blastomyces percursus TaxID=1658174 RepID=A0A1J9QAK6_9EURO|nr:hypothetical protein ACJ73_03546 [Blastomyces percursus]
MRLYLVPISTGRSLLYCKRIDTRTATALSRIDRITQKASNTWAKWEEADKGWKKSLVAYGNRVLQRIPYEEWGLKSVPPLSTRRQTEELQTHTQISLVYPKNVIQQSKVLDLLRQLATERQSLHRSPSLISHFSTSSTVDGHIGEGYILTTRKPALSGSKHLCFLLDNNLIRPRSLPVLETFYAKRPIINKNLLSKTNAKDLDPAEVILLKESDGKQLAQILGPHELVAEIERAVGQVRYILQERKKA